MSGEGAEGKRQGEQKKAKDEKAEEKLKSALRLVLEESAYERLMNVSHVNQEAFAIAAQQVLMAYQQTRRKVSDEELLYLLKSIQQKTRHEPRITFIGK